MSEAERCEACTDNMQRRCDLLFSLNKQRNNDLNIVTDKAVQHDVPLEDLVGHSAEAVRKTIDNLEIFLGEMGCKLTREQIEIRRAGGI